MSDPFGSGGGGGFGPPGGGPPQQGGFNQPPPGSFGQPPQGGFPVQQGQQWGHPPQSAAVKVNDMPAMVMALACAVLCCVPGGVIALIIVQQAKTAAVKGDQAGAESKLRLSMMISGASMVLAAIALCLYVGLSVAANS